MVTYETVLPNHEYMIVRVFVPGDDRDGKKIDYFSITAEVKHSRSSRDFLSCGAMHSTILEHFPELEDVVALHLSDSNGVPMHAKANGYYWLAGACGGLGEEYHGGNSSDREGGAPPAEGWCTKVLGQRLRISAEEAQALVDQYSKMFELGLDPIAGKLQFYNYIDTLSPRWKTEAEMAIAKYRG